MKKVIGITGGIASGKTTVCQYLIQQGYYVIDADEISRRLSQVDGPVYNAIKAYFGEEFFLPNQELNRKKLGQLIYEDASAREHLNSIAHPKIVEEMKNLIEKSTETIIFLDIPLLFEAKLSYLCDTIVCVYVDYETQLNRLMNRDHISLEYARTKIASQMSLEEKRKLSDFVVVSAEKYDQTQENIRNIVKQIKGE